MRVVPLADRVETKGYSKPSRVLSADAEYFVYAIQKVGRRTWYYIIDDMHRDLGEPLAYSAALLKVVEDEIPQGWITRSYRQRWRKAEITSFPEWANELGSRDKSGFYDRLLDGDSGGPERKLIDAYYARYETRTTPPQT